MKNDLIFHPWVIIQFDIDGADKFEEHVTHFYKFIEDRLIIGNFCAIAKGVNFIMGGANHRMNCATTYPFYIMGGDWGCMITPVKDELPLKGDTVVGNDVWIGQNVTIMPGVHTRIVKNLLLFLRGDTRVAVRLKKTQINAMMPYPNSPLSISESILTYFRPWRIQIRHMLHSFPTINF